MGKSVYATMPATVNSLDAIIGASPGIAVIREQVRRIVERQLVARRLPPLLIEGETGTGKGLLARAIHRAGSRSTGPLVDVSCAAIPDTLLEAELFGFERGAFTDARQAKPGLFRAAHRGTIFLDEIGLLPEGLQGKLLKVIEDREVRRLGSTRSEPVDVWIIAATSENLESAMLARRFREDLYHRLAVVTIRLPALRERGDDIVELAEHFLTAACQEYQLPPRSLTTDARSALLAYGWPGNVRELANVMERVAMLTEEPRVTAEMLGLRPSPSPVTRGETNPDSVLLRDAVRDLAKGRVLEALQAADWNVSQAAVQLGLPRSTLRYQIRRHGLGRGAAERSESPPVAAPAPGGTVPVTLPTTSGQRLRWEQRRLTFLRVVVEVSPSGMDPNRMLEAIIAKVRGFGGRVDDVGPAGIVGVFGLDPVEDAQRRAVHAARAILKVVERAPDDGVSPSGAARIAIHVAAALVGQVGETPQLDLQSKRKAWDVLDALVEGTDTGSIVVSAEAEALLGRRFELVRATGPAHPVYRLVGGELTGPIRAATFAGRRQELELLEARFEAAKLGRGQIVGIVGEPGIGKSRLLFEFNRSLEGGRGANLEGRCVSYGRGIPYLPIVGMVQAAARLNEADPSAVTVEKIRRLLDVLRLDVDEAAPYLLHLLGVASGTEALNGLEEEAISARTRQVLHQMCLASARRQPLVLTIEDMHWSDRASERYLAALAEMLYRAPVLLIVTHRPGYRPPWIEKAYATQIALGPLSPEDSLAVIQSMLPHGGLPARVTHLISTRAEGNPFFLEELTLAAAAATSGWHEAIPATVQEVLLARVEQAPPETRRLLQMAAVLGREPSVLLLREMSGAAGLQSGLRDLVRRDFLYQRASGAEEVYAFRHALVQEVAYETLAAPERSALHGAAGRALEKLYADRLDEAYDRLAYHFSKTDDAEKAVTYLRRAAARATDRLAYHEARAAYEQALHALDRLPESRQTRELAVDLRFELRTALLPLGEFGQVGTVLRVAERLASSLGETHRQAMACIYGVVSHYVAAEHEPALHALQRAQALGEALGDGGLQGVASMYQGYVHCARADFAQAAGFLQRCKDLLTGDLGKQRLGQVMMPAITSRAFLAWSRAELGDFETAVEVGEEGLQLAEAAGHAATLVTMNWGAGLAYARRGHAERALLLLERALDICRRESPFYVHYVGAALGPAYALGGDPTRAIGLLEETAAHDRRIGFMANHALTLTSLGDVYAMVGRLDDAATQAEQALAMACTRGEPGHEAYGLHLVGEIGARREPAQVAEASDAYRRALILAEKLGMRPLVAHCHLGLGKVYRAMGKEPQTQEHLGTAISMYREMDMRFWLHQAEGERAR